MNDKNHIDIVLVLSAAVLVIVIGSGQLRSKKGIDYDSAHEYDKMPRLELIKEPEKTKRLMDFFLVPVSMRSFQSPDQTIGQNWQRR